MTAEGLPQTAVAKVPAVGQNYGEDKQNNYTICVHHFHRIQCAVFLTDMVELSGWVRLRCAFVGVRKEGYPRLISQLRSGHI